MKNISTGAGLAILGLGIVIHPLVASLAPSASASSSTAPAAAIAAVANAQAGGEPTVVWYGVSSATYGQNTPPIIFRAWSDGTVEGKAVRIFPANYSPCDANFWDCSGPWHVISSPTQGFKAASDSNADQKVDGADLAAVLSNWGDAPRVPFPPSDCPLNLINP
jgi:hypothetical protein